MWRIYVNISWFQILVVTCAVAQGYVPSNTQSNKPQAQNSQMGYGFSSPSSGSFESETFQTMAQRAFDPTSDSMDFQEGNFQWKGRSFQLANQRVFRARFERFLLASPAAESVVYGQILQQVEDLLSVGNLPDYETLAQAWDLLFKASEYDQDGGNASIVANQVFNAWRIRQGDAWKSDHGNRITTRTESTARDCGQPQSSCRAFEGSKGEYFSRKRRKRRKS